MWSTRTKYQKVSARPGRRQVLISLMRSILAGAGEPMDGLRSRSCMIIHPVVVRSLADCSFR